MDLFSYRQGYKRVKNTIQVDSMDSDLRTSLWNALDIYYWAKAESSGYTKETVISTLVFHLWLDYFKQPIDTISDYWVPARDYIRRYFFDCEWFEAYDFVEFVANHYDDTSTKGSFTKYCNSILEREASGYRFVAGKIAPITSEQEIAEIEKALDSTKSTSPIAIHLRVSLGCLSDKAAPDYRNSIKESISAVEAACRAITGNDKATLGEALKIIQEQGKINLHTALKQAFSSLYGYTSDADGIRHALLDEPNLNFEDALFMLVSCSAFFNYLRLKASKIGIQL